MAIAPRLRGPPSRFDRGRTLETRETRDHHAAGPEPRDAAAADGRVQPTFGETQKQKASTTDSDANDDDSPPPPLDFSGLPTNVAEAFVRRLRSLESRVARREKHWAGVLREVHAAHAEETARARRACVAAVETKNAQIKTFREKLNAIAIAAHERRLRESGVKEAARSG